MLFFTAEFLFSFLPIVVILYHLILSSGAPWLAKVALVGASLYWYAAWEPSFLAVLITSVVVNYAISHRMTDAGARLWLVLGVVFNLSVLGYFKYYNFFIETVLPGGFVSVEAQRILLPLGISFFTFQQIAFLADRRHRLGQPRFINYALFVTFFPQLVAGPIVHHREMMPQFKLQRQRAILFTQGISIFAIGLFKKVVIADSLSPVVAGVFDGPDPGTLDFVSAWIGTLAYSFQIYFDFSGYCDMAVGIGLLFGIRLPINFNSPYKATSVIDFWRRWHITLSRFLRNYLYVPLGGNRRGPARRYRNLLIVMLLGGLWHGAGWTFVLWGGLHGLYLCINHAWRKISGGRSIFGRLPAALLTFLAVTWAWVLFRADDLDHALALWNAMAGGGDPVQWSLQGLDYVSLYMSLVNAKTQLPIMDANVIPVALRQTVQLLALAMLLSACLFMPNTQELHRFRGNGSGLAVRWRPNAVWAALAGMVLGIAYLAGKAGGSEFLYWNF